MIYGTKVSFFVYSFYDAGKISVIVFLSSPDIMFKHFLLNHF